MVDGRCSSVLIGSVAAMSASCPGSYPVDGNSRLFAFLTQDRAKCLAWRSELTFASASMMTGFSEPSSYR